MVSECSLITGPTSAFERSRPSAHHRTVRPRFAAELPAHDRRKSRLLLAVHTEPTCSMSVESAAGSRPARSSNARITGEAAIAVRRADEPGERSPPPLGGRRRICASRRVSEASTGGPKTAAGALSPARVGTAFSPGATHRYSPVSPAWSTTATSGLPHSRVLDRRCDHGRRARAHPVRRDGGLATHRSRALDAARLKRVARDRLRRAQPPT